MTDISKEISKQNDAFRSDPARAFALGIVGEFVHTASLSQYSPEEIAKIVSLVQNYKDFSESNDPYGEHDFGDFTFQGRKFFWKIDCFDINYEYGSPDPSDPTVTRRVLTIFFAEEY